MKKLLFGVALLGAMAAPGSAHAQTVVGPTLAYHDNFDFGIGGFVMFPVPQLHENLAVNVNFGYFFPDPDGLDYLEVNGDLIYRFPVAADAPVLPFVLGGLTIARVSVDLGTVSDSQTDLGLNIGGGIEFPSDSFRPIVGAKIELEGGDDLVLFGGLGFPVGD